MHNDFYCLEIGFGTPEFDEAVKLRYLVLRKPLNLEFDARDIAAEYNSYHIGCFTNLGELLAVLTLKPLENQCIKMRQVAVDPAYQSKGLGSFLVQESERFAFEHGYIMIELNARDTAIEFYRKLGYESSGDIFKEVGIDHIFMTKPLV